MKKVLAVLAVVALAFTIWPVLHVHASKTPKAPIVILSLEFVNQTDVVPSAILAAPTVDTTYRVSIHIDAQQPPAGSPFSCSPTFLITWTDSFNGVHSEGSSACIFNVTPDPGVSLSSIVRLPAGNNLVLSDIFTTDPFIGKLTYSTFVTVEEL
jgi:hypothetical protein